MFEKLIDVIMLLIAALQENTASHKGGTVATDVVTNGAQSEKAPPAPPKGKAGKAAPAPPAKPADDAPPDFGGAAAAKKPMTKEEANEALVNEWKRLGGNPNATSRVNDVFAEFGVTGLLGLKPGQYAELITKMQALEA